MKPIYFKASVLTVDIYALIDKHVKPLHIIQMMNGYECDGTDIFMR